MSGFFGFDTSLPDDDRHRSTAGGGSGTVHGFQARADADSFLGAGSAGVEEDLAVYQWGEGMDASLLEGGDDFNDETFGDLGDLNTDFQFSSQPVVPQPIQRSEGKHHQPRGPIASTQSHFRPKQTVDLFAATEDDFYSSRPAPKKTTKPAKKKAAEPEPLWAKASPANAWGAAPSPPPASHTPQGSVSRPPPQILSLDEIEANLARTALDAPHVPPAPQQMPKAEAQHLQQPRVLTLEEIEQQMVAGTPPSGPAFAQPPHQPQPPHHPAAQAVPTPPRESPPQSAGMGGSGYAQQQQALLDSMFGEAVSRTPVPAGQQPGQPPVPGVPIPGAPGIPGQRQPSPEELAKMEEIQRRVASKIEAMSKYNNFMGNSDKDFITRIQLSQLATADPYSSDFYAQVYSALMRRQEAENQNQQGPTVVQVAPGVGFGVGAPTGNRFGKMGNATMQRLTTQVKKLVATTAKRQQNMSSDALQGALGKVPRRGPSQVAPRPVLAIPTATRPEHRPANILNQATGPTRPALTRKQVMVALEELYDDVLDLEQMRRDAPPPNDPARIEAWNHACAAKVEDMWRKLMVMEPLGVSTPHPFISLMNPLKGHRLFPRLLRHLPHQQTLTLLTLLIATYPQLDVVARAPPPPVADTSLLTKADRLDRARREAETDSFLHHVIPGVDSLINQCTLGLVSGLLGICAQRMEVWKVAATRPGVALFTALLSKAQSLVRADPTNPNMPHPDPAEVDQWNKTFAYLLQTILPHLPDLFPSSQAQKVAFGPGAYFLGTDAASNNQFNEKEVMEIERREAEVWGLAAALAVNAPEDQQTNLVAALREKILHTVQAARDPMTAPTRAELKLRNVNMFLHGLGLDASMIE